MEPVAWTYLNLVSTESFAHSYDFDEILRHKQL